MLHNKSLPSGFRVIDVYRRCVTEIEDCDFLALSYVWGPKNNHSLVARTNNINELKIDGSLDVVALPQTIVDAMTICEHLQQRYLWVDRLCIVQDDLKDKMHQIGQMGHIYSSALFVIIAAHGDAANFGIPGVSRPRRTQQQTAILPGLTITNAVRERPNDPLDIWPSRGWYVLYFYKSAIQELLIIQGHIKKPS
tara:strand:- start:236 stop:820 length:585 start_codon:yes stop_codon:yes gene_type:complete